MSSAPIAIKSASPASSAPSSPSSGLYIPVHKRRSSIAQTDDSMSTTSSSRPSSRAESYVESDAAHVETLVYSRDRLLALAKSPLATMSKEVKDGLREQLPEIVMSRKHRKAIEYRTVMQQRGQGQSKTTRPPVQAPPEIPATATATATGPVPAPARPTAKTVELAQPPLGGQIQPTQQRHTYYYHITQPGNTPQQRLQAMPRDSHSRPVGRAWWSAPKSAPVNGMNWRRAPGFASIPVV